MSNVLSEIISAHGGKAYWDSLESLEVELSADGFLFTSKGVKPQRHARITVCTSRPEVTMHDYPMPGQTTRFVGGKLVETRDAEGRVLQSRTDPRAAFGSLRRQFRWDALDFAYFSSYAMWGYLTVPFLLLQEGVVVTEKAGAGDGGTQLAVRFPQSLPVHCADQQFFFDKDHRLTRLDYTAEVVGGWATAAHLCEDYRQFGGLWLPTRRRVYPKFFSSRPLRFLTLVAIDIHNVIPHAAGD
jgi:hypothetical protein